MALQQEIWSADIQEILYPSNSVLLQATDDSAFVHYQTVHVPSAGANATITKNLNLGGSLASVSSRTDNEITYRINSYAVSPVMIPDLETYQIAYDKRKSIMYDSMKNLETVLGNQFLYGIAPAATLASSIIYTTGALVSDALVYSQTGASGPATGTRRAVTLVDIFALKGLLDRQNVPDDGNRILLFPTDIWNNEVLQIANILQAYQLGAIGLGESVVATGVLARVAGFKIMTRPTTVAYNMYVAGVAQSLATIDGSGVPTVTAGASWGVLAWHPTCVSVAKSSIEVFYQPEVAQAYGALISFLVWEGSAPRRYDNSGIVALVQANS